MDNEIRLVGLVGKAGSGKDTLADEIAVDGWEKVAFADSLKHLCMDYLGLSHDDVYTQEGKMRENPVWGMTNRAILQKVGTEAMRNGFDKDVWVKILGIRIRKMLAEGRKVIVTDCRFDNECQLVEDMGGIVVEVVRDAASNLSGDEQRHASEQPVSRGYVSFTIENNRDRSRLRGLFDASMRTFLSKWTEESDLMRRGVEAGVVTGEFTSKAVREMRKFLRQKPEGLFAVDGRIRLEWAGGATYGDISVEMSSENGIIVHGRTLAGGEDYGRSFQFGDADGWDAVNRFVAECRKQ